MAEVIIVGIGIIVLIAFIYVKALEKALFEVDPDNKFRRKCRECGQVQENFGEYHRKTTGYWNKIGPKIDPECLCHYYSKDG